MKSPLLKLALLVILTGYLIISCTREEEPGPFFLYPLPEQIDPEVAARLTKRKETDNYIFYYAAGDTVQFDRCEAYVKWGLDYLEVTLPKKIEYFKFRSFEEMKEALGSVAGGWAFPEDMAYATLWKWHNHEAMHLLSLLWSGYNYPTAFFVEGIAVAHEYDPYNNSWISQWNREEVDEPYTDIVSQLHAEEKLYPLADIMESDAFHDYHSNEGERVAYPQAGVFTAYLIDTYGLDKFKEVFTTLDWEDSIDVIENHLELIYGKSLDELEQEWYLALETP